MYAIFGDSGDGVWVVGMGGSLGRKGIAYFGESDGIVEVQCPAGICLSNSC